MERAPASSRPARLLLEDGTAVPSELTLWRTGARAEPWLADSGLPVDPRGFLLVDRALRSVADPRIFAAGDAATLEAHPAAAKAGVYAVRHGPVLWRSLRAAVRGGRLPAYRPQEGFLALLNTADGRALLRCRRFWAYGRWAFRLKDHIDRRFVARYREPLAR